MYATVNAKSSYSRPDEIYAALDEAGFYVYSQVLKENGGFFLKFDTTTVVLTPGQQVYAMPPDLSALVNLAERLSATERWRTMAPTDLGDAMDNTQSVVGWDAFCDLYGGDSAFRFYGPYLPAANAVAAQPGQTQQITVTPAIDQVRMCEIAYTAKWLPIVNAGSPVMLPDEGTYAMQSFALAELHRSNDNTLAGEYDAKGQRHLTAFLTWVRGRQTVERPRIVAYLDE